ncbi:MAG TPA: FBP domain-containing protein [Modestobacter sp.]|nr:FBP domain-containing protein [Modestobacter sp.]
MQALTDAAIRRSMVNCSRSEATALTPPRDLDALDWAALDVLGWRDAKAELRGYLVHCDDGEPLGIALRASDTRMSSRRSAMCLLGHTVQPAASISLFTAHRMLAVPPSAQRLDEELQALAVAEQTEGLRRRLRAFTGDVLRR